MGMEQIRDRKLDESIEEVKREIAKYAELPEELRISYQENIDGLSYLLSRMKKMADSPIIKFIVVRREDGGYRILCGTRPPNEESHKKIAELAGISLLCVIGGGLADLHSRQVYGESLDLGPFPIAVVHQLLPEWEIASGGR